MMSSRRALWEAEPSWPPVSKMNSTPDTKRVGSDSTLPFFVLACALTWILGFSLALAWMKRVPPAPYAIALAGLSALGPTLSAFVFAARRHELRQVFGRWRVNPVWIAIALFVPMALHLPATLLDVALGGHPAQWFYLPAKPEHVAALVMFSVFEEFGWRGFAYPRLARRYGPVVGCGILGVVWALWHLVMVVSPETGAVELVKIAVFMVDLPLYSLVLAWFFERGNRSMAVAIALHAGSHLDNVYRAPESEIRLRVLRVLVLAVAAALAARSLAANRQREQHLAPAE